ncbi:MAG: hypothetical protein VYE73_10810, partial [Acidobacteriota bacterium]|nr:hypothetical protein [Acidobacteriota bacterium]
MQALTPSTQVTGNVIVAILCVTVTIVGYAAFGHAYSSWFIMVPVIATVVGSPLAGLFWTVVTVFHLGAL